MDGVEQSAEILSAYLGAVDVRFPKALENVSGSPQVVGDDGMPLVMSVQVDASTLSPEDFAITTASGMHAAMPNIGHGSMTTSEPKRARRGKVTGASFNGSAGDNEFTS